jgi:hypothetical protein
VRPAPEILEYSNNSVPNNIFATEPVELSNNKIVKETLKHLLLSAFKFLIFIFVLIYSLEIHLNPSQEFEKNLYK